MTLSGVVWGASALSHDASLAVVVDGELVFAGHAERYSRRKNDPFLNDGLLAEAAAYGPPDLVAWYERPLLKKLRHLRAGQFTDAVAVSDLPSRYLRSLRTPFQLRGVDYYAAHHASHRAAGFATSGFDDAVVVTADAIGEFDTLTIARCRPGRPAQVLHRLGYPHSLGLLYSAFTRRCGFRPNEDEYVVMGMAPLGEPRYVDDILTDLVELREPTFRMRFNPHRGIGRWQPDASVQDLAASVQRVTEEILLDCARWAQVRTGCRQLVLAGGLALNCVANARLAREAGFEQTWIFPNPGDAGSSFGAVADALGGSVSWPGPYLGTDIAGDYPVDEILSSLLDTGIAGVASGRAEFGPRALGNRSILADPRPADMKDRVNAIKGRELFRPFAPVVRRERADEFFDMPVPDSPYMQFTARCRLPAALPAVTHVDGTSRVQTVAAHQHAGLHELLLRWEERTGCATLLNTSLNGRSQPLVNNREEADAFASANGVRVW